MKRKSKSGPFKRAYDRQLGLWLAMKRAGLTDEERCAVLDLLIERSGFVMRPKIKGFVWSGGGDDKI